MVAQSFGSRAQYVTVVSPSQRPVGYLLALGIFIAPYIFGWLVLRAGYSAKARIVTFGWCFIILTATLSMNSTDHIPVPLSGSKKESADKAISEMALAWNARESLVSTAEGARLCEVRANTMVEVAENHFKEEVRAYGMNASDKGTAGNYYQRIKDGWSKLAQYCHEAR